MPQSPASLLSTIAVIAVLTGCGASSAPTASPTQSATPDRTIAIAANDQLRFAPDAVTVKPGETVAFTVTNTGTLPHEFIIGDDQAQRAHGAQMDGGMTMGHGNTADASVPPGKTVTVIYTFGTAGTLVYGCHVTGHYEAGMKGTITIG